MDDRSFFASLLIVVGFFKMGTFIYISFHMHIALSSLLALCWHSDLDLQRRGLGTSVRRTLLFLFLGDGIGGWVGL